MVAKVFKFMPIILESVIIIKLLILTVLLFLLVEHRFKESQFRHFLQATNFMLFILSMLDLDLA
jgi:hypothetical protein